MCPCSLLSRNDQEKWKKTRERERKRNLFKRYQYWWVFRVGFSIYMNRWNGMSWNALCVIVEWDKEEKKNEETMKSPGTAITPSAQCHYHYPLPVHTFHILPATFCWTYDCLKAEVCHCPTCMHTLFNFLSSITLRSETIPNFLGEFYVPKRNERNIKIWSAQFLVQTFPSQSRKRTSRTWQQLNCTKRKKKKIGAFLHAKMTWHGWNMEVTFASECNMRQTCPGGTGKACLC